VEIALSICPVTMETVSAILVILGTVTIVKWAGVAIVVAMVTVNKDIAFVIKDIITANNRCLVSLKVAIVEAMATVNKVIACVIMDILILLRVVSLKVAIVVAIVTVNKGIAFVTRDIL